MWVWWWRGSGDGSNLLVSLVLIISKMEQKKEIIPFHITLF